jgi:hypothetical protein
MCVISCFQLSNYSSMEGVLYCKPHFEQLFKETGSFNKNFQSRMSFILPDELICSISINSFFSAYLIFHEFHFQQLQSQLRS